MTADSGAPAVTAAGSVHTGPSRATRPALTAIITTFNEEANILKCLESVAFADEVLLVDSFSTDRTVEIARAVPGVKVVQRQYFGSAAQKNWAMDQITTSGFPSGSRGRSSACSSGGRRRTSTTSAARTCSSIA